jgi:hypothetical protein
VGWRFARHDVMFHQIFCPFGQKQFFWAEKEQNSCFHFHPLKKKPQLKL